MKEQRVWKCIKSEDWAILTPEQIAEAKANAKDLHSDPAKHIPLRELESEFIQYAQAKASYEAGEAEGIKTVVEWLERTRKQNVPKYQLKEGGL